MIRKTKLFKHISYVLLITILITNISSCISIDFFGNLNNNVPAGDLPPLKTEIVRAYEELKTSLNVKSYNIPYHKDQPVDVLKEILEEILVDRPDLFYIEPICIYTSESKDGGRTYIVEEISLSYKYSANEIINKKADFKKRLNKIIEDIPFINDVSDEYKVILAHDYICLNYNYDKTLKSSDVYTMLSTGVGTCQAYCGLLKCILDKINIETSYIKSDVLNHIWNSVKIDNDWYIVDCTWDDIGKSGVMLHARCLISECKAKFLLDNEIAIYEAWKKPYDCINNRFDNAYWRNCISPLVFISPDIYYYIENNNQKTYLIKCENGNREIIYEIINTWKNTTTFYDINIKCYSGLIYHNGYLYFNDSITIYRYSEKKGVEEYEEIHGGLKIYGLSIKNNCLLCELSNSFMDSGQIIKIQIAEQGPLS